MKKIPSIFLLAFIFNISAYSQELDNKNTFDVYAGYGILTVQDIVGVLGTLAFGNTNVTTMKGFGAYYMGGDYYLNKRFSLGGQLNYANYSYYNSNDFRNKISFITPMVRGKIDWGKYFYSSLALGITVVTSKEEDERKSIVLPSFQVSPIGFKTQGSVMFFAELGFGFQGMITAGVAFKI